MSDGDAELARYSTAVISMRSILSRVALPTKSPTARHSSPAWQMFKIDIIMAADDERAEDADILKSAASRISSRAGMAFKSTSGGGASLSRDECGFG